MRQAASRKAASKQPGSIHSQPATRQPVASQAASIQLAKEQPVASQQGRYHPGSRQAASQGASQPAAGVEEVSLHFQMSGPQKLSPHNPHMAISSHCRAMGLNIRGAGNMVMASTPKRRLVASKTESLTSRWQHKHRVATRWG